MTVRTWIVAAIAIVAAASAGYFYWQLQLNSRLPDGIAFGNGRIEAVQVDVSTKILLMVVNHP